MSSAREWLANAQVVRVETDALLAVLGEIDRLFANAQARMKEQGYDAYDEGVIDAVGSIERVVDEALGVTRRRGWHE